MLNKLMLDLEKEQKPASQELTGYSRRITDPAFARYLKDAKRMSYLFSSVLALAAVTGFYIYGETSAEMDNPGALYIGLAIGGMFLGFAFLQSTGRNRSTTWDGVVVDKQIEKKRRKKHSGDRSYWEQYTLFSVIIKKDNGKIYTRSTENDDTVFNYFKVGDKVRHHGGLNSIEKFDKTGDEIIFCGACAYLNDIRDDFCVKCKCPLLK
ncbi:MAG: hypothetical protein BWY80_00862 [Firmicutes bacterium ADurb.Bin456]|nr:MAG: hypothetical protein BWY80_00862 [Firmicutes bacterium ADurb.Bin456]